LLRYFAILPASHLLLVALRLHSVYRTVLLTTGLPVLVYDRHDLPPTYHLPRLRPSYRRQRGVTAWYLHIHLRCQPVLRLAHITHAYPTHTLPSARYARPLAHFRCPRGQQLPRRDRTLRDCGLRY